MIGKYLPLLASSLRRKRLRTFFTIASILIVDGKSTWFTGAQLIAVYLVMAITVFAIPA